MLNNGSNLLDENLEGGNMFMNVKGIGYEYGSMSKEFFFVIQQSSNLFYVLNTRVND